MMRVSIPIRYQIKKPYSLGMTFNLVRAARIELASHAWKARILAIIRRPHVIRLYHIFLCFIICYNVLVKLWRM